MNKIIKCVVPISGGKDSQTCLKLASEQFEKDEIIGLFCDTQFEHPLTYEHIERMKDMYGVEIITRTDGDVLSLCRKHRRFPSGTARFCTSTLKINVSKKFYKQLAEQQGCGFEVWYGMRFAESKERAKRYENKIDTELYEPHEIMPSNYPKYLGKLGVKFRLPILDWHNEQVYLFLKDEINPLYKNGFDRVGCFPCLAGGDKYKEMAFQMDDFGRQQHKKVQEVEKEIGKLVFTSKGAKNRNYTDEQICSICQI